MPDEWPRTCYTLPPPERLPSSHEPFVGTIDYQYREAFDYFWVLDENNAGEAPPSTTVTVTGSVDLGFEGVSGVQHSGDTASATFTIDGGGSVQASAVATPPNGFDAQGTGLREVTWQTTLTGNVGSFELAYAGVMNTGSSGAIKGSLAFSRTAVSPAGDAVVVIATPDMRAAHPNLPIWRQAPTVNNLSGHYATGLGIQLASQSFTPPPDHHVRIFAKPDSPTVLTDPEHHKITIWLGPVERRDWGTDNVGIDTLGKVYIKAVLEIYYPELNQWYSPYGPEGPAVTHRIAVNVSP